MKKCNKKIKTKEKRLTLKERRLEKVKSNKFIGIFTGLLISFWTNAFLTLDKIIAQKNMFCQEGIILMLNGILVCLFYWKYKKYIKTNTNTLCPLKLKNKLSMFT